jgi:hypothetical protein
MRYIDVCNGDADGLCALHQWRLAQPVDAELVTGLKREIELLTRVDAGAGAEVTVLDLSLARNRTALDRLLAAGARVRYVDHHEAGAIPRHPQLEVHIDPAPQVCTSMIVDRLLGGRYRAWAVAAAFGDNFDSAARELAATRACNAEEIAGLRDLGIALNYAGYGDSDADVLLPPRALYARLHRYADPWRFGAEDPIVDTLLANRRSDLAAAGGVSPLAADAASAVFVLPAAAWSRRVLGTFANELASEAPQRAHAVLKDNGDGSYAVSVRAPLARPQGAAVLCRQFATGGGRAAAAGIDRLPASERDAFIAAFRAFWQPGTERDETEAQSNERYAPRLSADSDLQPTLT